MKYQVASIAALLTLSSMPSLAGEFYVGAAFGNSRVDTDGVNAITAKLDDSDSGSKLLVGYKLLPEISLEAAYANLGTATLSGDAGNTFQIGSDDYEFILPGSLSVEGEAITLGLLAHAPIADSDFGLFARLGLAMWETEVSASFPGTQISIGRDGNDLYAGIGAHYNICKHWALRAEFENLNVDGDAFLATLGATYSF